MGAVNSCNCTKDGEKNELDLMKEQVTQRPQVNTIKSARETNIPQPQDEKPSIFPAEGINNLFSEKNEKLQPDSISTPINERGSIEDNQIKTGHAKNSSHEINLEVIEDNPISPEEVQLLSNGLGQKNLKKYNNIANNISTGNKPPLEIINELNMDLSKDSEQLNNNLIHEQIQSDMEIKKNPQQNFDKANGNESLKEEDNKKENNLQEVENNKENLLLKNDKIRPPKLDGKNYYENLPEKKPKPKPKNIRVYQNITSIIPETRLLNCGEGNQLYYLI
jgi:hypothetical protein